MRTYWIAVLLLSLYLVSEVQANMCVCCVVNQQQQFKSCTAEGCSTSLRHYQPDWSMGDMVAQASRTTSFFVQQLAQRLGLSQ